MACKGGRSLKQYRIEKNLTPDVSIITIVYNEEQHLEETILSVLNQKGNLNIEYIIIDGGSDDGSLDIIKKYEDSIDFWISEKDKGISDAFNKGITFSKGKIVGMVNANDWYESDAVESTMAYFPENDVVYGDVQFWDGDVRKSKTNSDHQKLRTGMTVAHPAVFMKRELYDQYGLFDLNHKVAMDYGILVRLYWNKVKFKKIDKVLVNMRMGGLSEQQWLKGVKEEKVIKDLYFDKWGNLYYFIKQVLYFTYTKFKSK